MVGQAVPVAGRGPLEYTVGTPPQTPILRPLRQPIFDSERYPAAGAQQLTIHTDPKRFSDGTAKTARDTNQTQGSQLGTPLEFDLVGFNFEVERGVSKEDHDAIYNAGLYRWFFGQSTDWLRLPLTRIPEGISLQGAVSTTNTATTVAILSNGWGITHNFYNFTTPDRRARRIVSTESFRLELTFAGAPAVQQARRMTNYMLGILYTQL